MSILQAASECADTSLMRQSMPNLANRAPFASIRRSCLVPIVATCCLAAFVASCTYSTADSGVVARGITVHDFILGVKSDIASQEHVEGVAKVSCHLPQTWTTGATFRCSVYNSLGAKLGDFDGVAEPTEGSVNGVTGVGVDYSSSWHPATVST